MGEEGSDMDMPLVSFLCFPLRASRGGKEGGRGGGEGAREKGSGRGETITGREG